MNSRNTVLAVLLTLTILAGTFVSRQATAQTNTFGPSALQAYDTNGPNGGADPSPNISPFSTVFGAIAEFDGSAGPAESEALPDFRGLGSTPGATYFFLEDFEDGQFDVPGATYSSGSGVVRTEAGRNGSAAAGVTGPNSIDEDNNGGVNNEGRNPQAGSFRQNPGATGVVDFSAAALGGNLPTHVGIAAMALEPNNSPVTIEAFDENNNSVATVQSVTPYTACSYGPDSACFMGIEHAEGIARFEFKGDWDWDHLQYGFVPEPSSFIISGLSLLGFMGFALRGWGRGMNRG